MKKIKELASLQEVDDIVIDPERKLYSATHEEILAGLTTDIYFIRAKEIIKHSKLQDTIVAAEVFANNRGVLAGVKEVINLFKEKEIEIFSMDEGAAFEKKEVIMVLKGKYSDFAVFETALLGILASSSGWAAAAREVKEAAGGLPVYCFGARHLHPAVAPVMERAAVVGGVDGCSCVLAAKLLGQEPVGTVPHAVFLIVGDTVKVARAYHEIMPQNSPRIILVDTFKDEAEETLRVAGVLGKDLNGVRLDTPGERGGVTPDMVREIRIRLNKEGYEHVKILASGGITVDKIKILAEAGTDAFGVGSYIARAPAIDMTMDIKEINGREIAKRGRIPGLRDISRLKRIN